MAAASVVHMKQLLLLLLTLIALVSLLQFSRHRIGGERVAELMLSHKLPLT